MGEILAKALQLIDIVALLMCLASKWFGVFGVTSEQLTKTLIVTIGIELIYVIVNVLRKVYK